MAAYLCRLWLTTRSWPLLPVFACVCVCVQAVADYQSLVSTAYASCSTEALGGCSLQDFTWAMAVCAVAVHAMLRGTTHC